MTVIHVEHRIRMINILQGDFEAQHAEEDQLFEDVLRAIAAEESLENARELAEAALEAKKLKFARVCA